MAEGAGLTPEQPPEQESGSEHQQSNRHRQPWTRRHGRWWRGRRRRGAWCHSAPQREAEERADSGHPDPPECSGQREHQAKGKGHLLHGHRIVSARVAGGGRRWNHRWCRAFDPVATAASQCPLQRRPLFARPPRIMWLPRPRRQDFRVREMRRTASLASCGCSATSPSATSSRAHHRACWSTCRAHWPRSCGAPMARERLAKVADPQRPRRAHVHRPDRGHRLGPILDGLRSCGWQAVRMMTDRSGARPLPSRCPPSAGGCRPFGAAGEQVEETGTMLRGDPCTGARWHGLPTGRRRAAACRGTRAPRSSRSQGTNGRSLAGYHAVRIDQ